MQYSLYQMNTEVTPTVSKRYISGPCTEKELADQMSGGSKKIEKEKQQERKCQNPQQREQKRQPR